MRNCYNDLFNLNPKYSTTISFLLGMILISDLNSYEQNMLGNWIMLLAQTILTNAASQNIIESRVNPSRMNINSKEIKCVYNPIVYDINRLKELLDMSNNNKESHSYDREFEILEKIIKNLQNQINQLKGI